MNLGKVMVVIKITMMMVKLCLKERLWVIERRRKVRNEEMLILEVAMVEE